MQAHLRMLDRDKGAAIAWGRKAMAMAKATEDPETLAAANMVVGASMLVADDPAGRVYLDRSIQLGRLHGFDSLVALSYLNIGSSYGEQYHLAEAEVYLKEAVAYATERDLEHSLHYSSAWLALVYLYQGRWPEAAETASDVLRVPTLAVVSRIMALVALGRVRARRGDPGTWAAFDEALELASGTATLQRIAPVRAARAEAAWLGGDSDKTRSEAMAAWDLAVRHRHSWHLSEFGFWRSRAGDHVAVPPWAARPFALQVRGQWAQAADEWETRGCPYERAQALAQGDDDARRGALGVFDRLGARPAAEALRQLMRDEGASRVPRGPTTATRSNNWGLTRREAEILALLPEGLTNAAIARRLHISSKTVDHHVSAILSKLGATSRAQAARSVLPIATSKTGESAIEK
jgi:DNA-binding CsgD family transcriptional regulator